LIRTVFVCLLLLAGCSLNPPLPAHPPASQVTTFAFTGRLAVRQGETRHHLKIDWRHARVRDEILLATPLGQGVAEIVRDGTGATLLLADRRRFAADDWSTLAEQVFGFRLPLDNSARWLLGEPLAGEGWRMTVVERESTAPDALPTVIELERDDIAVRLKIDEWTEAR
jgi:outer membrane lipoprotein LolB